MVMQDPYSQWLMQDWAEPSLSFTWPNNNYNFTSPSYAPSNSLFGDLLEEDPELAYYGQLQRQNLTPNQRRYFQSNYGDYRNQYLGELGASLYSGELPTQKFTDYLNQRPLAERYAQLPPSQRRQSGTGFAPPTRLRLRR